MKGRVATFDAGSGWRGSDREGGGGADGGGEGGEQANEDQSRSMGSTGPAVGYAMSVQHDRVAN